MLNNITVVLVETSHPGNIGAAARALKTMGLSKLTLVNPKEFPSTHAFARAAGAVEVLENATVVKTLEEALAPMHWVVGTSARGRTFSLPMMNPKTLASTVINMQANIKHEHNIAIVFGRESHGLSNDELMRCNAHVSIPSNPDYSALNIAAAIQIIAYEIYEYALEFPNNALSLKTISESYVQNIDKVSTLEDNKMDTNSIEDTESVKLANGEELEGLYTHLQETLTVLGVLNPDHPRLLMKRLRRLYGRAQLDIQELNILRGILSATLKKINKDSKVTSEI